MKNTIRLTKKKLKLKWWYPSDLNWNEGIIRVMGSGYTWKIKFFMPVFVTNFCAWKNSILFSAISESNDIV